MNESDKTAERPLPCVVKVLGSVPEWFKRQTPGAAAFDIAANDAYCIEPGDIVAVGTGLHLEIPKGYVGLLNVRSSLHKKGNGLHLANMLGYIDSDYRGEVKMMLHNPLGSIFGLYKAALIDKGERIGQIIFVQLPQTFVIAAKELSNTQRGQGAFGSTNRMSAAEKKARDAGYSHFPVGEREIKIGSLATNEFMQVHPEPMAQAIWGSEERKIKYETIYEDKEGSRILHENQLTKEEIEAQARKVE